MDGGPVSQQSVVLHNNGGGSDKVYAIELKQVTGGWVVNYRNGRRIMGTGYQIRGNAGGTRTHRPRPYDAALRIYRNVIREKQADHYVIVEQSHGDGGSEEGGATVTPEEEQRDSGRYPMLLTSIEEEAKALQLCDNPSYCGQEKEDGERRMLLKEMGKNACGVNRKGEFVPVVPSIRNAADIITLSSFLVDGEEVGETLRIWDLLEHNGENLREQSMQVRYERLSTLVPKYHNLAIRVVPTAFRRDAKLKMFHEIKARGGEGMIFKLVAAPYVEGASKYALKYKFKSTATVQVVGASSAKRSIQVGVASDDGVQFAGNVAIPVNKDIPSIGHFIEVEYLYAFPNGGSLFQPVYLGPRSDKDQADRYDSLKLKRRSDSDADEDELQAAA